MKVGDLVKYRFPATPNINKTFLISKIDEFGTWVQLYGGSAWCAVEQMEVISASR